MHILVKNRPHFLNLYLEDMHLHLTYHVYQDNALTADSHLNCAINRISGPIVSCTAVCPIWASLDVAHDIIPIHRWQLCTVCHSCPSNVWCWFTSCITTQSNQGAFTNIPITAHMNNFRGNCSKNVHYYSRNTQRIPLIELGRTFINRERIALLESEFHFQIEYCNVLAVALFQIRNAG